MYREENLIIDLKIKEYNSLKLKQMDTTRINFNLVDNGLAIDLTNLQANIIFTKPNGNIVIQKSNITIENSNLSVILLEDCLRQNGKAKVEVELKNENETVSTFQIPIQIEPTSKENIHSNNTPNYIEEMENTIKELKENGENAIQEIRDDYEEIVETDLRKEIVDARGDSAILKDRLDGIDNNMKKKANIEDLSKDYVGTNITANTVEGFGTINKLYGDTVQTGTGDKSPDNPYKIECVGDDINLFDGVNGERTNKYINDSGQEVTGQSSDVFIKQVISVASNRLIMSYEGRIAEPVIRCSYFNGDTFISREVSGENNHVFNVPENTSKIDIRVDSRADNLFQNLKLQFGTVATTYSPYNKGTVVVTSSNNSNTSSNVTYTGKPLCCLKDAEGNIVLQDYIDYKRGKVIRQCGYKILNGTEPWFNGGLSEWTNSSHLFWTKIDDISAFDYNISNQFTLDNINTVVHSTTKNHIFAMYNYNSSYNIVFLDKNSADANAFKQKLAKNNMILVYKLATPIEEDIECTDKIVQYEGSTTIQSDAKIDVTLNNNKAISQIYENIEDTYKRNTKNQVITDNFSASTGTIQSLYQYRNGKYVTVMLNIKFSSTAGQYFELGRLKLKPIDDIAMPAPILNHQAADGYNSCNIEMLFTGNNGIIALRTLKAYTNAYVRVYLTYLTNDV